MSSDAEAAANDDRREYEFRKVLEELDDFEGRGLSSSRSTSPTTT